MARLDILLSGYDITDEIINRSSSSSLKLDHDTIRGTSDLEIWTGAGGTGTQLSLTTDYTVAGEDTRLSTAVGGGVLVYTTLAIVNGAYHSTDLYVTYKTIGDYASASTARLIGIGAKVITGAYTATANDRAIIVNTAAAVTITIPDGLPIGFDLCISRTLASTYAITVAMSGSDTIEGASSFITHGAYAASTLNGAEVTLRKKLATAWNFVSGVISGSVVDRGTWSKTPDHKLIQSGVFSAAKAISTAFLGGYRSSATEFVFYYPIAFKATPPVMIPSVFDATAISAIRSNSSSTAETGSVMLTAVSSQSESTRYINWYAEGEW